MFKVPGQARLTVDLCLGLSRPCRADFLGFCQDSQLWLVRGHLQTVGWNAIHGSVVMSSIPRYGTALEIQRDMLSSRHFYSFSEYSRAT
jgi:hypothetical protein